MSLLRTTAIAEPPWRVLVVDDDQGVHEITQLSLGRFEMDNRRLKLMHAYSGAEAKQVLEREDNIALVFLDVVMEKDDSGLEVARWMREDLKNRFTRIVLRTGQPGQAPEEKVIFCYDINDYREKTELDRKKLFTATFAALRAYRDIISVEEARKIQLNYRQGLERVIAASASLYQQQNLFDFSSGLLQQVLALLNVEESMFLRVRGESAIAGEENYEVLASVGKDGCEDSLLSDTLRQQLSDTRSRAVSQFFDDTYVAYFPGRNGKASFLALKGLQRNNEVDAKLLELFANGAAVAFDNILLNQEISETQSDIIMRLGDVVESRSNEAGNHVRRIAELCYMLARASGMSEDDADILRQAAPMHDIGKIATPDDVLLKPGKLSTQEWSVMKRHPETGYSILNNSRRPILKAAAIISYQHHEKVDGTGYPQGLQGEQIHPYARIVAVADVFDALTHARCYKPAWSIEDTLTHLRAVSGTHLDEKYVRVLIEHLAEAQEISGRFPN